MQGQGGRGWAVELTSLFTINYESYKSPNGHSPNADMWLAMEQPQNLTPSIPCLDTKAAAFHSFTHVPGESTASSKPAVTSARQDFCCCAIGTLQGHPQPSVHFSDSPAAAGPKSEPRILRCHFSLLELIVLSVGVPQLRDVTRK